MILLVWPLMAAATESFSAGTEPAAKVDYSQSNSTEWHISTRQEPVEEATAVETSALTIRVYDGFGRFAPFRGRRPAVGVDVTSEIEHCPDGNDRISRMNIGGWMYEVDGDCSDYSRQSKVSVIYVTNPDTESQQTVTAIKEDGSMHCDEVTKRCRIVTSD